MHLGRRSMQLASTLVAAFVVFVGSVAFSTAAPARATDAGPVIALLAVSCPDANAVPANQVAQPSVDDTGGVYQSWGPARSGPVSTGEANDCTPRSGVTFRLSSVDRGAALSSSSGSRVPIGAEDGETTTIVGTTGGSGLVVVPVANLTASQLTDLERGNSLWVSGGAGTGFLGLRCHTDLVNSDDLEYFRVAPFAIPGRLSCIHYSQSAAPPPTTSTTVPVPQAPGPTTAPHTSTPPVTAPPTSGAPVATTAVTQPPHTQPPVTKPPATTSTTSRTTSTTAAGRHPTTTSTTVGPTPTTVGPTSTSSRPTSPSTSVTAADEADTETALPPAPGRVLVRVAAPGSGPLSASLTTVWTQDLVLSLACGDDTLEIRIAPGRAGTEQDLDVPPHLVDSTCDLTVLSDGVERVAHDGPLVQITVDGARLAEGDSTEVELDANGPAIEAVYAGVGDESVLPALAEPAPSGGGDRLPLVPVGLGLLVAALAGGVLIGRTGNRG